ncbi:predicted protein [Nematostella vectensis]|uniref:6-phosphogluconolactonase n=1 Tax=Nematostella vectensis TaxID=45351 RepID=A7RMK1_NEMVE|nr:6-phosphogluconolactonase [Nematostella vectensis]EDO47360.1 predicted protein [Nematostella vectensis]|eukprot:XP_001639423.1 predicted protein [Nematostella vectensis]
MATKKVHRFSSEVDLQMSVCSLIAEKSTKAIADHGFFAVAFSGGSSAKIVCKGLVSLGLKLDFSKWRVFFCDERYASLNHPDSNYKLVKDNLLDVIKTKPECVISLDYSLPLEKAAVEYEKRLRELFPSEKEPPQLDMLLLGMGPDGHICSLFPGHPLLTESSKLVAAISDSPKPPPSRITLTYALLNEAHSAVFVATGSGKAEVVKRVLEGNESDPLPAARLKLTNGDTHWFVDDASASLLTKPGL